VEVEQGAEVVLVFNQQPYEMVQLIQVVVLVVVTLHLRVLAALVS
jgi:hypothetical protein